VIRAQTFTTEEDVPFSGVLTTTPGATVTITRTSNPSLGVLTSFSSTGSFTYVPNENAFGVDTFSVEAVDSPGNRAQATITVNVTAVNDAPLARGEKYTFFYDTTFVLNVASNDEDVEDQALSPELYVPGAGEMPNPAIGSAAIVGQTIELSGLPDLFRGVVPVSYRVRDSAGETSDTAIAYVFINIEPFDIWYSLDQTGNVYVTDLLSTRAVTAFEPPISAGNVVFSDDKLHALISQMDGEVRTALWLAGTRTTEPAQRLTPELEAGERIEHAAITELGHYVAYIVIDANENRRLWIVTTSDPSQRTEVVLPDGVTIFDSTTPMQFHGGALYFEAQDQQTWRRLYRVHPSSPGTPEAIFPKSDEIGRVITFHPMTGDSQIIVHGLLDQDPQIYVVDTAAPFARTVLNGPLNGDSIDHMAYDAQRVAYVTRGTSIDAWTDDRVFIADLAMPGISTLVLDADPDRTGPILADQIAPSGAFLLMSSWARAGTGYRIDLAELALEQPDGVLNQISPIAHADTETLAHGAYDVGGNSILFTLHADLELSTLYEANRDSLATPRQLGLPGLISDLVYDDSSSIVGLTHSLNTSDQPFAQCKLINRSAPEVMIEVPGTSAYFGWVRLHALVDN
jgi:hypothetical protein